MNSIFCVRIFSSRVDAINIYFAVESYLCSACTFCRFFGFTSPIWRKSRASVALSNLGKFIHNVPFVVGLNVKFYVFFAAIIPQIELVQVQFFTFSH